MNENILEELRIRYESLIGISKKEELLKIQQKLEELNCVAIFTNIDRTETKKYKNELLEKENELIKEIEMNDHRKSILIALGEGHKDGELKKAHANIYEIIKDASMMFLKCEIKSVGYQIFKDNAPKQELKNKKSDLTDTFDALIKAMNNENSNSSIKEKNIGKLKEINELNIVDTHYLYLLLYLYDLEDYIPADYSTQITSDSILKTEGTSK